MPTDPQSLMSAMRARLEKDAADGKLAGITVDDLMDAISHPKAAAVIAKSIELEAQSVQEGATAPDFTLPWLAGSEPAGGSTTSMTLSAHFGKRPVALIFGSYT